MALLDTWRNLAYQTEMDNKTANEFWGAILHRKRLYMSRFLQIRIQ